MSVAVMATSVEKLYEYGATLTEATDYSKHAVAYKGVIDGTKGDAKAKQLAAQFIPKFAKHFPDMVIDAIDAQLDLCEEEEPTIRVQAIRGLPILAKENVMFLSKIADVLGQLLILDDRLEQDAVKKALVTILNTDAKETLNALFKHIESEEDADLLREKVLLFLRDRVFPIQHEWMKPKAEMERFVTDLVKKVASKVTLNEFRVLMEQLSTFSIFARGAPKENGQELLEIVLAQAKLDKSFQAANGDDVSNFASCLHLAVPLFKNGVPNSKLVSFAMKNIVAPYDQVPAEKRLPVFRALAEIAPHTTGVDARPALPAVLEVLKKLMPRRKDSGSVDDSAESLGLVEAVLYILHQFAAKATNALNSLCGYKVVTGQPSDRLGENFDAQYSEFTERLAVIEDKTKQALKKLNAAASEHAKELAQAKKEAAAETDKEAKAAKEQEATKAAGAKKAATTQSIRVCNNVLALTKPLHAKVPTFLGETANFALSWKESKPAGAPAAPGKRPGEAINGNTSKKGRGGGATGSTPVAGRAVGGRGQWRGGQSGQGRGARGGRGGRGRR